MRKNASYLGLLGAVVLVGCPGDPCMDGTTICVDVPDSGVGDTMIARDTADAPRDTPDVGPVSCGSVGQPGGACREPGGVCTSGMMCQGELGIMGETLTLRSAFGIEQGEPDPTNPGYFRPVMTADPANDVPLEVAPGNFCTAICDATLNPPTMAMPTDVDCTTCSTCTETIGLLGIIGTGSLGMATVPPTFGDNTGWCRADCVFDPATDGGCPDGYTCSPSENVCVEACTSDNQCRWAIEERRDGLGVTILDPTGGTCNATTGRCDWTLPAEGHVGDTCEAVSDCTEDVGFCINGGTCAEVQCNAAGSDTEMGTFNCDLEGAARNGICLGFGGNNGAICVQGCTTAMDCNPGNACLPLGMAAGPYTGYCLGLCDLELNDPDGSGPLTMADDEIWTCRSDERCDVRAPTTMEPDPAGACRPTCMVDTDCNMALDEQCELVGGSATFGFCRVPDQVCNTTLLDEGCYLGQRCDLLGIEGNLGLCVDECAMDSDCATTGDECDMVRGVCRTPCTAGGSECVTGETCLAGFCEQMTT